MLEKTMNILSVIKRFILYFLPTFPFLFLFLALSIGGVGLIRYLTDFGFCYVLMIFSTFILFRLKWRKQKILVLSTTLSLIAFYLLFSINAMAGGLSMAVVDGGHTDWVARYLSYVTNAFVETLFVLILIIPYAIFVIWLERFSIRKLIHKFLLR